MKIVVMTNNPRVYEKFGNRWDVRFDSSSDYLGVLRSVRDHIHRGCVLLTHPLSGSIKPDETPYKSVLLSQSSGTIDMESLNRIEDAIRMTERMIGERGKRNWTEKILADFQLIDCDLIGFALEHASQHHS